MDYMTSSDLEGQIGFSFNENLGKVIRNSLIKHFMLIEHYLNVKLVKTFSMMDNSLILYQILICTLLALLPYISIIL